jgi:hypothetical protein
MANEITYTAPTQKAHMPNDTDDSVQTVGVQATQMGFERWMLRGEQVAALTMEESNMRRSAIVVAALLSGITLAHAQNSGTAAGAVTGAVGGAVVGGPIGAVVGGVAGATLGSALSSDDNVRIHKYIEREHRRSARWDGDLAVGSELPPGGVEYYEFPPDVGVREYRYAVINDHTVLVDPRTRRIVEVIN